MSWLDSVTVSIDITWSKCQEILDGRGYWHATVRGVAKSRTWLSD